jgi:transcription elongation GreA/GreB family factor/very-short-patch-repair endonuclease
MDDSDGDDEATALEESESILDVSQTKFQPARRLRWHYRSQHHSLIHFSNSYFYKDRPLFVFPSPFETHEGLGIHWRYVSNGLYENRQNAEEAVKVVDAVFEHIKKYPKQSLGVVTLNGPQRDLIQDEFDKRLKSDLRIDRYLNAWKSEGEPLFIKNLENVQGDERDVIIISTTFGKNRQGVFHQRFGPITSATGWRRLNVLFTRAKKRIELFSSMQPEDIRIDSTMSKGVQALKNYLNFAKTGNLDAIEIWDREADSDFEIAVGGVLENNGYQILPQLGVAGFFIDIAVRHPDRPGEFLAAIECDGATYHRTKSARDRDRLRQEILEKLGWKDRIYRIWSADWFKDPKTQTKRLLDFLQATLEKARKELPRASPVEEIEEAVEEQVPCSLETVASEPVSVDDSVVQLWDYVTYTYEDDPANHKSVQIVKGHTDVEKGVVGDKMPLARALLGASIGDAVELNLPGRPARLLTVLSIER